MRGRLGGAVIMKKTVELKGPPDEEDIFLKVHYSDESALPDWQLQYIDGAALVLLEPVARMEQVEYWLSQQHKGDMYALEKLFEMFGTDR
ncbi:hypothetical protein O3M35_013196 [Rhynocoris fuscipes]|uniref:Uncharacterized protein n=1 Tax=Rhynocoris fuscipes TaxID=488301 RepID=A0AAW1CGJ9_9HEMI